MEFWEGVWFVGIGGFVAFRIGRSLWAVYVEGASWSDAFGDDGDGDGGDGGGGD